MPSCKLGGSSCGSAVAVAAGLVDFAVGKFMWLPLLALTIYLAFNDAGSIA